ncbi:MAG: ankyrin repeat domain-containing protein [candidate division Zixibacteria bacterium]|nr:ankyrin repeat domain-containing protein [candidate division Zixibacteria bacterium]
MSKNSDLLDSVKNNDMQNFRSIVKSTSIEKIKGDVIYLAAELNHRKYIEILMEYGVSIDTKIEDDWRRNPTALITAILEDNLKATKLLLDMGANIDAGNDKNATPLFLAVLRKNTESTKLLVDYSANIDVMTDDGWTPISLVEARISGELEIYGSKSIARKIRNILLQNKWWQFWK